MGFGTPAVALATTPTVVSTFFSHFLSKKSRKGKAKKSLNEGGPGGGPEDELSYEEGLKLVRRFLDFASHHGVEEVQAFTAMPLPTPHWVNRKVVTIPTSTITRAEDILEKHLGTYGPEGKTGGGIKLVGGSKWWRVRGRELEGEWIEMQKDYLRRTANRPESASQPSPISPTSNGGNGEHNHHHRLPHRQGTTGSVKDNSGAEVIGERVILYIHGGAFFFSSLDTHRYQVQRHARKAGARAFSPAYRLAPQYPFPCALLDALASYLYLLDPPPGAHAPILPTSIILMGDSAGAGMVISLLIVIREMGLPMPAGASLVSPWVDLTHSMPSIGGWDGGDFIPSSGFHYKPSSTWPPVPGDGISVKDEEGNVHTYNEQIQMYCPNNLLTHPLVSPVNQGSLGGLCPILIIGGGGELLRDEMTYLAYKAASPTTYPTASGVLASYPDQKALIDKYKPTRVHLQIYDGCCHVVPTLSWTRSSKYMYRACANFNIWAYTAASKALIRHLTHKSSNSRIGQTTSRSSTLNTSDSQPSTSAPSPTTTTAASSLPGSKAPSILDLTKPIINSRAASAANAEDLDERDAQSEASTSSEDTDAEDAEDDPNDDKVTGVVTVRGREPIFGASHIIAERVSNHGKIRPFEAINAVPALDPALREVIGQVHPDGAVKKWMAKRAEWDDKYAKDLKKWRDIKARDRGMAEQDGFLTRDLHGERPPLAALAGVHDPELARSIGKSVDEVGKKSSMGMLLWAKMSSKADEEHSGGDNLQEIKETVEVEMVREERRKSISQADKNGKKPIPIVTEWTD